MYKLLARFIFVIFFSLYGVCSIAKPITFVSLVPATTEIMYAIGAQDSLIGVSTMCNYPEPTKFKDKVGNNFFLNKEKIIELKPDYVISIDSAQPLLTPFNRAEIKTLFLKFRNINDIYSNILFLGNLTNKEQNAQLLVSSIKLKIKKYKAKKPKKILYLVQYDPMVTVGKNSFITNVIKQSGNQSVTEELKSDYPVVTKEYALKVNPQVIVLSFETDLKEIKKLFPKAKIITLNKIQRDVVNRPGPRIYLGVKFFSEL